MLVRPADYYRAGFGATVAGERALQSA